MTGSSAALETEASKAVLELLRSNWVRTTAPVVMRTDDIWFLDDKTGWAVNGHGQILKTVDCGESWVEQAKYDNIWLRCVGFADPLTGWVGTVGGAGDAGAPTLGNRLLHTIDGGASWTWVTLPEAAPYRVCGLCVADAQTIYLSGTNNPTETPAVMKSVDGGQSWASTPLGDKASLLVDILFRTPSEGWVVGGLDAGAGPSLNREDIIPVVLHTTDGGQTWVNLAGDPDLVRQFPRGEWGWKIQYLPPCTLLVALENERDGAILRSDDDGATWMRLKINDQQRNSNLEGIGFLTPEIGWVGGWGDLDGKTGWTSMTTDGGVNWRNANEVGRNLNRFRFLGDPVHTVMASGDTVYRLAAGQAKPVLSPPAQAGGRPANPFPISVDAPAASAFILVTIWDRFGSLVRALSSQGGQTGGQVALHWDLKDTAGARVRSGPFMMRVTVDQATYGVLLTVSAAGAVATFPAASAPVPKSSNPSQLGATAGVAAPITSFASDVRPLFRELDRNAMLGAFDLFDYAAVKANAPAILARLQDGSMPCDAPWSAASVALFQHWIDQGMCT